MNAVFATLVLGGLLVRLISVVSAVYLLFKRVSKETTEIEFAHFDKIKTTQGGLALAFLGIFLFWYSASAYDHAKQSDKMRSNLDSVMTTNARELHKEFHLATDGRIPPLNPDSFSRVDFLIRLLQQIDSS